MKKVLISAGVIIIFAGYAIYQHMHATPTTIIPVDPTPITQITPTPAPTNTPTTTPSPAPAPVATTPTPTPTPVASTGQYKNGQYTGSVADALYGKVQVQAIIQNGKLTDVQFLTYPNDPGHTIEVNQQAMPILKSEAIAAQSANVDVVSGATQTSQAFQESLQAALDQAKS